MERLTTASDAEFAATKFKLKKLAERIYPIEDLFDANQEDNTNGDKEHMEFFTKQNQKAIEEKIIVIDKRPDNSNRTQ